MQYLAMMHSLEKINFSMHEKDDYLSINYTATIDQVVIGTNLYNSDVLINISYVYFRSKES